MCPLSNKKVCQLFNLVTKSMYSCMAASFDFPFSSFQALYFALATKSNGLDGASPATSPSVLCLYNEYNFSNVSLSGLDGNNLLFAAACPNSCRSCIGTGTH